jgi:UDP-N-acetylmuramyl pentapeptide phosphotransferase/UDP-N-acetylglucosamine-1-phosphate transferase
VFAGQVDLALISIFVALALFGFLLFNFPFGRIFLGDAGAYTLGFTLSWIGVALVERSGTVSAWAVVLMLFWPIADTMLAVGRRVAARKPAMEPDRLHVHQVVMRMLEARPFSKHRKVSNPLTTVILLPFVIFPALMGVVLAEHAGASFLTFVGLLVVYSALYGELCKAFKKRLSANRARHRLS